MGRLEVDVLIRVHKASTQNRKRQPKISNISMPQRRNRKSCHSDQIILSQFNELLFRSNCVCAQGRQLRRQIERNTGRPSPNRNRRPDGNQARRQSRGNLTKRPLVPQVAPFVHVDKYR